MKYVMYVVFYSYYICRVALGHRQLGRLALRTSVTYIYIYPHTDNVKSCK